MFLVLSRQQDLNMKHLYSMLTDNRQYAAEASSSLCQREMKYSDKEHTRGTPLTRKRREDFFLRLLLNPSFIFCWDKDVWSEVFQVRVYGLLSVLNLIKFERYKRNGMT